MLLHGYWSVSAISLFSEYQLWEGARKISREPFHFLSSLKDRVLNKKLSPALHWITPKKKDIWCYTFLQGKYFTWLVKAKTFGSLVPWFLASVCPTCKSDIGFKIHHSFLCGESMGVSGKRGPGAVHFNSSRRKLHIHSLESNHYCFYVWGLNQMLRYLSFIAHPLVILHWGCHCIR